MPAERRTPMRRVAAWFGRGLLVTVPAAVTIYVSWQVIRWVDGLLRIDIPGVGLVVTLIMVTVIGALATTWATRAALGTIDRALARVPFARLLYSASKDLLNAFVGEQRRFTRAVRVAITEDGAISVLGFVTAETLAGLATTDSVAVYLPQSYNFAGQLLVVRSDRVTPLSLDGTDVMTFIVSGGVSGPGPRDEGGSSPGEGHRA